MKKIIYTLAFSCLFFASCDKNESSISNTQEAISFNAEYDAGPVMTKAGSPFTTNNKVTIFGYGAGQIAQQVSGTPLSATGGSAGELTTATQLFLPKGNYDFYAVSTNTVNAPGITVDGSGLTNALTNGVDYLYAKNSNVSVSAGTNIPFTFYHKAVAVEVNVASGTGVSNLTVQSIRITPSAAGAKMALSTGTITPATSKASLTSIPLTSNTGKYIMLPLATGQTISIEVTVNATIGGTPVTNKIYTATIPSQTGGFQSGNYYIVNLTANATALNYAGSTVENWTTQEITGISLTEQ